MQIRQSKITTNAGLSGILRSPIARFNCTTKIYSFSCEPNCRSIQHSSWPYKSYCMALRPIQKGEELTISYVNTLMPTFMRRQKLAENWYFDCICQRYSNLFKLFRIDDGLFYLVTLSSVNHMTLHACLLVYSEEAAHFVDVNVP